MSYRERYQEFLEKVTSSGGPPTEVEECIAEYNRIENPLWNGSEHFARWLREVRHVCSNCSGLFEQKGAVVVRDEIRCNECLSRSTTPAGGAVDVDVPSRAGPAGQDS
jgi:DNA-directed RNA polymerase subunit RPC12/RpoP